jgi:aminoglycoside 3-N-acetyltransferase
VRPSLFHSGSRKACITLPRHRYMLTKKRIAETITRQGVRRGDHLLVHSSLRSIGPIDGGADALIDGLIDAIGPEGTLAMPAFNYTRPLPSPYFDPQTTPSRAGALTECFWRRPEAKRSLHPTHSVAAQGERAEEFLAGHLNYLAFGIGSPIDRLAKAGGYVLLAGVTHLANSCIHIGESYAGATKFYWQDGPLPIAKVRMPDGRIENHRLDCSSACSRGFNSVEYWMRSKNLISDHTLGNALCFLMRGSDVIETVVRMIGTKADVLLCSDSNCRPCTMARAHISGAL